jgi:EAL domain-containing protein (putative c-di-GMP-specific phosphodiesterase class I)/GGDEF domain-containing protein
MLNRDAILAAIGRQLAENDVGAGGFAVVVVYIRGLRQIALRFGSECGEQAEAGIRKLLRESLRPLDAVFQSGDETFLAVLPGLSGRNNALLAAAGLMAQFEQPHAVAPGMPPWQTRAVMGVALFPQDGTDPDALWRHAQMAADDALRRGERYAFHDPRNAGANIDYHELRESIESNRLLTFFQPIWSLAQSKLVGVESLARWTSRKVGPVSPDDFVTFAEQNDLITSLTRWSIHSTLRYVSALRGLPECRVALNLSPRTLAHGGVAEQLLDALNIWGVPPAAIVAEITETALAGDVDSVVRVLGKLRERGVRIAIDDFGVGYASITYLSKFPASELKIDKSLVAHIAADPRMAKLVESIVQFAHNLGLETTAEGIEDAATQRLLQEMGCDFGQGFHLGKPEPAADFVARYGASLAPDSTVPHAAG